MTQPCVTVIAIQPSVNAQIIEEIFSTFHEIFHAAAEQKWKALFFLATLYAVWLTPALDGSCKALSLHF